MFLICHYGPFVAVISLIYCKSVFVHRSMYINFTLQTLSPLEWRRSRYYSICLYLTISWPNLQTCKQLYAILNCANCASHKFIFCDKKNSRLTGTAVFVVVSAHSEFTPLPSFNYFTDRNVLLTAILIMRTYAISGCNRRILLFLAALMLVNRHY